MIISGSYKNVLLIILVFLTAVSCEKVIDVDLNEVNPQIVIEAELNGKTKNLEVKITQTASYFGNGKLQLVSDAVVLLGDNLGGEFTAVETDEGIYTLDHLPLKYGATYYLTVIAEGKTYEAQSVLHPPVEIIGLDYFYEVGGSFFDSGYYLRLYLADPAGEENFYRIKLYKNGRLQNDAGNLILFSDNYMEGKEIEITLRGTAFREGMIARAELITLDKGAYDFLRTFDDLVSTNPGSAAPANPITNFSNDALGYFSAFSYDQEEVIINP